MANWLDKALGRQNSEQEHVPYECQCACGCRLSGVRGERGRRVICPECGEALFVLPVNRYPVSERRYYQEGTSVSPLVNASDDPADVRQSAAEPLAPTAPVTDTDEPESSVEDFFAEKPLAYDWKETSGPEDSLKPASKPAAPARRRPVAASRRIRDNADWLSKPVLEERTKTRQKLVLVITAAGLLLMLMTLWLVRSSSRDRSETAFLEGLQNGERAFEAGDYGTARLELARAVAAAEHLGMDSPESRRLRHLLRHAETADGLLAEELTEIFAPPLNELDFTARYGTRWLLLDQQPVQISEAPATLPDNAVPGRRLVWPINADGRPVHVAGVEQVLKQMEAVGPVRRIVLAGRLKATRLEAESGVQVLELDPDTVYLCTRFDMLDRLGLTASDEAAELRTFLESQKSAAGDAASGTNSSPPAAAGTSGATHAGL